MAQDLLGKVICVKHQSRWLDVGYQPATIIQTMRLGIPKGPDGHLTYRFVDQAYVHCATENPLGRRCCKATAILFC